MAASLVSNFVEGRIRADTEQLLNQFATQSRKELAIKLESQASLTRATAVCLEIEGDWSQQSLQNYLDPLQEEFPEFA